jgi:hypothetical protein
VRRVIPEGRTQCGLCSRLRRGALYRYAREQGFTRIALGHHRDDLVETLFLNLFHGGRLKAMPPKLLSDDGANVVIRPLCYVPEREIARYARAARLPDHPLHALRLAAEPAARGHRPHAGRTGSATARAASSRSSTRSATSRPRTSPIPPLSISPASSARRLESRLVAKSPLPNSHWIEPERLLAGEHPPARTRPRRRSACVASSTPASTASST